jgi:hypothetical protein
METQKRKTSMLTKWTILKLCAILIIPAILILSLWGLLERSLNQSRFTELWIVYAPMITSPMETDWNHRHKNSIELTKILNLKEEKQYAVDRKFNSSILYLSAPTQKGLEEAEIWAKSKSKIPFLKVLTYDNSKKIIEKTQRALPLLIITYVLSIILLLIINFKRDLLGYATLLVVLFGMLSYALLRFQSPQISSVETKVINNLIPYEKSYFHRFAATMLKSMVAEMTIEKLRQNGHNSGFKTLSEQQIFFRDEKSEKADSLWFTTTASDKEAIKTKIDCEMTIKDFVKKASQTTQTEINE